MAKKELRENLFVDPASEIYINIPNMSLAYAATVYDTPVVDQHVLPYPRDRFMKYETKTLGISIRSFAYREAMRIIKKYSHRYPQANIKSISGLDVQCCYPFFDLSEHLSLNVDFSDNLPFPRYELFDSFNYLSTNWRLGLWHYPLLTSLGCPYQCIFCASRNRTYKTRSVENCVGELAQAKEKYRIVSFEIIDDCFNLDKSRVMNFCETVRPLKLTWLCSNGLRADRFDEEEASALKSSGCKVVGFGIESVSQDVLEKIRKGETIEQIEKAVKIAKRYFSEIKGYFIIGLPGSSYEKDLASIEWVRRMAIKPIFSYYLPESNKLTAETGSPERIFFGSKAQPQSCAYSPDQQHRIYSIAKKQIRRLYHRQKLPFRLIYVTIKALVSYNFNSILTHFIIGPKRFLNLLIKGEVQ